MRSRLHVKLLPLLIVFSIVFVAAPRARAQEKADTKPSSAAPAAKSSTDRQTELEAKFSKSLSGATLEGSYTLNGPAADTSKLRKEKYTLGDVKKLAENTWLFPARIQYGGKDVTLPIPLPVEWAGDTPVIVVDNVTLPGFGTVSARVLFFDGHYAGYWKHGDHSGNLFGTYRPADEKPADKPAGDKDAKGSPTPSRNLPAAEKQTQ